MNMLRGACMVMVACLVAEAQDVDPYDHELLVYWLESGQRSQFSTSDGSPSAFWDTDWANRDRIDLIAPDNANPDGAPFTGTDDASVVIKAAADCAGLYLLCSVEDNTWVDKASADDWGADAIDLYLDNQSADDIATCDGCYIGLYNTTLTYATQQFQVWMGASALPASLQYQAYDDNLWAWAAAVYTFADLTAALGIEFEVMGVDATHKAQEWFIPWRSVGNGGLPEVPSSGTRIALSGGYNDKDGDNPSPGELRWLGRDPWAADAQQTQYWGDLAMGDGFVAGTPCAMGVRGVNPATPARVFVSHGTAPSEYLIDGRRAGAGTGPRACGVVVIRSAAGTHSVELNTARPVTR